MGAIRHRLQALAGWPAAAFLVVGLVAVRFIAPTVSAYLAVEGLPTDAFDTSSAVYDGLLPLLLLPLLAAAYLGLPGGNRLDAYTNASILLSAGAALQWAGVASPGARLISGPWTELLLGETLALALVAWCLALQARLRPLGLGRPVREFRILGFGFATAYGMHAFKFVDYGFALGATLPSGLLWLFDFGPVLLLCALALRAWILFALHEWRPGVPGLSPLLPPLVLGGVAALITTGLAGYILSNTLSWGGGYALFAPSSVSLTLVGFAVGAFVATAGRFRSALPTDAGRLLICGVCTCALAGLVGSGGSLASLAGLQAGLALAALGVARLEGLRRVSKASPGP